MAHRIPQNKGFMDVESLTRAFSALAIDPPPSKSCIIVGTDEYTVEYPVAQTDVYVKFSGSGLHGWCLILVAKKNANSNLAMEVAPSQKFIQANAVATLGKDSRRVVVLQYRPTDPGYDLPVFSNRVFNAIKELGLPLWTKLKPTVEGCLHALCLGGKYSLITEDLLLGKGAYGVVLLVQQANTTRRCAMKVFHRGMGGINAQQEVKALTVANQIAPALSRPLIGSSVVVLPGDQTRDVVITEYGGVSLKKKYAKGSQQLSFEEFKGILHAFLDYYEKLYQNRWEHGDLKLDNIVIDEEGRVSFIDYGEGKLWGEKVLDFERTSLEVRTPATLFNTVNGTASSFALGCDLARLLTGTSLLRSPAYSDTPSANMNIHLHRVFSFLPPTEKFSELLTDERKKSFFTKAPESPYPIEKELRKKLAQNLSGDSSRMILGEGVDPEDFINRFVDFLKLMLQYEEAPDPRALKEHPFVHLCFQGASSSDRT